MASRIVVMKDGVIQQVDSPQKLYDQPCNVFVAGFLGSPQMNFLKAFIREKDGQYFVEFGKEATKTEKEIKFSLPISEQKNYRDCLKAYIDKEVIIGIRPEHIHDEQMYLSSMPEGIVDAKVEVTELMGAETYLYMDCAGQNIIARVDPKSTARPQDDIKVTFDTSRIHIFDKDTELTITN